MFISFESSDFFFRGNSPCIKLSQLQTMSEMVINSNDSDYNNYVFTKTLNDGSCQKMSSHLFSLKKWSCVIHEVHLTPSHYFQCAKSNSKKKKM